MKKVMFTLLAISMMWAGQSSAAEMKIVYVDIKAAMENTKLYTSGMKRVEALQNKKKKELEAMRKRVTDLEKELQLQSMALSNERQTAKQQEFMAMRKDFERQVQDATDELKKEKMELDQKMYGKFYDAVRAYGKQHKIDLILPKATTVYASPAYDITADITKVLDAK